MARRRRKGKAGKWVGRLRRRAARRPGALSARGADRLAGPRQSRLDRAGARHDRLSRRQRRPCRPRHAGARAGPRLEAAVPAERLRRGRSAARWIAFGVGRAAGLSRHADLVGHHAAHDLVGADRRQAGDARRICRRAPTTRRARSACGRKNIAACGQRSAPISRSTRTGRPQRIDHPGYGPADAFYRATGQGKRDPHLQRWVADWLRLAGRQDQPVAAVRQGPGLAIPAATRQSACSQST